VPIPCSRFVSISGCLDLAVVWHQWIDPRRAFHQSPAGAAPGRLRRRIDSFLVKDPALIDPTQNRILPEHKFGVGTRGKDEV
jgi:hypothetical protein